MSRQEFVDLADFAYRARQLAETAGEWSGTATELWCILFLEHRAAHFARSVFDIDPLPDLLCLTLRFALQIIDDDERAVLVKFMEAEKTCQDTRRATCQLAA